MSICFLFEERKGEEKKIVVFNSFVVLIKKIRRKILSREGEKCFSCNGILL